MFFVIDVCFCGLSRECRNLKRNEREVYNWIKQSLQGKDNVVDKESRE